MDYRQRKIPNWGRLPPGTCNAKRAPSVQENNPIPERTATETIPRSGKQPYSRTDNTKNNMMENEFWKEKAFWKDMLWFSLVLGIIYVVYVTIEYWPEITEGFNRGWNSR